MVGIRLACNPSSPLGLSGDANGFVPTRKTEERLALPVRSALTRFTEDRARAHARRSCTSHLTVVRKAASELHWSRLVTPIRSRKRLYLNGLAGFGHAVPSKRSSPPAAKWAVCICEELRRYDQASRWIAAFSAFAVSGPRLVATTDAVRDRRRRPPKLGLLCAPSAARHGGDTLS